MFFCDMRMNEPITEPPWIELEPLPGRWDDRLGWMLLAALATGLFAIAANRLRGLPAYKGATIGAGFLIILLAIWWEALQHIRRDRRVRRTTVRVQSPADQQRSHRVHVDQEFAARGRPNLLRIGLLPLDGRIPHQPADLDTQAEFWREVMLAQMMMPRQHLTVIRTFEIPANVELTFPCRLRVHVIYSDASAFRRDFRLPKGRAGG